MNWADGSADAVSVSEGVGYNDFTGGSDEGGDTALAGIVVNKDWIAVSGGSG